jgi:hypothetical protein
MNAGFVQLEQRMTIKLGAMFFTVTAAAVAAIAALLKLMLS